MQPDLTDLLVNASATWGDGENALNVLRLSRGVQNDLISEWLPLREWDEVEAFVHPCEWQDAAIKQFHGEPLDMTECIRLAAMLDLNNYLDDTDIIEKAFAAQEAQQREDVA